MTIKHFIIFELLLGLLACTPPTPQPQPEPDPTTVTLVDTFDGFSTLFMPANNLGNLVTFENGLLVLNNPVSGCGWVYTPDSYELPGLEIVIKIEEVSNDFCGEFPPTVDDSAKAGFYLRPTRFRAYVHSDEYLLHVEYVKAGVWLVNQPTYLSTTVPAQIRLRFTADSLFYDYFVDSLRWVANTPRHRSMTDMPLSLARTREQTFKDYQDWLRNKVIGPPRQMPEYSVDQLLAMDLVGVYERVENSGWINAFAMREVWQGEWHFALTSVGKSGTTKVDRVTITMPLTKYGKARLSWNKNRTDPDVAGYAGVAVGYDSIATPDTIVTFEQLPLGKLIHFKAGVMDTAGNWNWSNPDTVKKVVE